MEETNYKCQVFFPSVYKIKVSFKILCCHNNSLFQQLNLTFLKRWVYQCVFPMGMFFLSYVNELCIYPRLFLQVGSEPIMAQQTSMFYPFLLSCVSETMYLLGNRLSSRFMSIVLRPGITHLVPMLSQNACCGWGAWCNSLSFEVFPFSN